MAHEVTRALSSGLTTDSPSPSGNNTISVPIPGSPSLVASKPLPANKVTPIIRLTPIKPYLRDTILLLLLIAAVVTLIVLGITFPAFSSLFFGLSSIPLALGLICTISIIHIHLDKENREHKERIAHKVFQNLRTINKRKDQTSTTYIEDIITKIKELFKDELRFGSAPEEISEFIDQLEKLNKNLNCPDYEFTFQELKELVIAYSKAHTKIVISKRTCIFEFPDKLIPTGKLFDDFDLGIFNEFKKTIFSDEVKILKNLCNRIDQAFNKCLIKPIEEEKKKSQPPLPFPATQQPHQVVISYPLDYS